MKKIRLTRTTIVEYEINPDYYPEGLTYEEMAESDVNADYRESLFVKPLSDKVKWEIID